MSMDGGAWAQAVFAAIPGTGALNAQEKQGVVAALKATYTASQQYLAANVTVSPSSLSGLPLQVPTGVPVTTAGSATAQTGTTTGPGTVAGTGSIS